ncbi:hypothetical protein [Lentibacillus halodurans]|nr:hypothetical protein [Lentibacillus halodurans]
MDITTINVLNKWEKSAALPLEGKYHIGLRGNVSQLYKIRI